MSRDSRLKPLVETACGLDPAQPDESGGSRSEIAQHSKALRLSCSECGKGISRAKQKYVDLDIIEKAQSMVRCGHGDGFISDYLGMVEDQVSAIRARLTRREPGRPRGYVSLPPIDDERARTTYAENCRQSSEALARAIGRMA